METAVKTVYTTKSESFPGTRVLMWKGLLGKQNNKIFLKRVSFQLLFHLDSFSTFKKIYHGQF
jgi:hypothetical protein